MNARLKLLLGLGIGAVAARTLAVKLAERRNTISFRERNVLITGGSRGLGLVLARQLAAEGARVALCARDPVELEQAAAELRADGATVFTYACDLTQPEEIDELMASTRQTLGPIDVLINNAGVIQVGPANTMTEQDVQEALALHLWAPFRTIRAAAPEMAARGGGRIVNIASIGGEISVPHLLPYCISKFALVGYSRGITSELAKAGIFVTTICPGLMRTGSHLKAGFKGEHRKEFRWFSISASAPVLAMSAERAARQIIEACRVGRAQLTLSWPARAAVRLDALAPELMADLTRWAASLLPSASSSQTQLREGIESTSFWSPSWLTALGDRAARRNNELSREQRRGIVFEKF